MFTCKQCNQTFEHRATHHKTTEKEYCEYCLCKRVNARKAEKRRLAKGLK